MNCIIKPVDFDYNTNIRFIEDLIKEYPFLSAEIIGRSTLGRGIFSLSVGNTKNSVIYVGGLRGGEGLTGEVLLLFTEKICHSIKHCTSLCGVDMKRALSQLGITVIPSLNPDGIEIASNGFESAKNMQKYLSSLTQESHEKWEANAMGVDISRNFSYNRDNLLHQEKEKGIDGPSNKSYGGEHSESEAETKVITRLCRLRKFRQCMALQFGNDRILWQNENSPKQSSMMVKILADSCAFTPAQSSDFDNRCGLCDWFTYEFSSPAFTFEIEKDKNINLYETYEKIEEALTLFALM